MTNDILSLDTIITTTANTIWAGTVEEAFTFIGEANNPTYPHLERRVTFDCHGRTDEGTEEDDEWYEERLDQYETCSPEEHLDRITIEDIRDLMGDPSASVFTIMPWMDTMPRLAREMGFEKIDKFHDFFRSFHEEDKLPDNYLDPIDETVRTEMIELWKQDILDRANWAKRKF